MFITRTISGIVLLAVTMCAIIASGPLLYLFMLLISLVGMYELYRVFQMEKKIPALVGYLTAIGIESVILAGKNDLVVLILVLGFFGNDGLICGYLSKIHGRRDCKSNIWNGICGIDDVIYFPNKNKQ